MTIINVTLHT